LIAIQSLKN